MAKRWIGIGLALIAAAIVLALLGAHWFTLSYGDDVRITFDPAQKVRAGESDLILHRGDYALQTCCKDSTFIATAPGRPGHWARAFRVRPSDPLVKGSFRSELRMRPNAVGETVWYRIDTFVPADWQYSPQGVIATQWHGSKDAFLGEPGKAPPLAIAIEGDHWTVQKTWDHRLITRRGTPGNVQGIKQIGTAPLQRGAWARWTVRVHWSTLDKGMVQAWLGDNRVVDDRGPNAHRDLLGPYLKSGVYVPSWHYRGARSGIADRVLYFDDIEVRYGDDPFGMLKAGTQH